MLGKGRLLALALAGAALGAGTYDQRYRPQFHFTPAMNWTNDPCGLVMAFGLYHLFFQHNPYENKWGHMSWGHATTPDLVHWKQLPVAIPEGTDVAIFTGSSVVDERNTSGLCAGSATPCLVSIFTGYTPKTANKPDRQTQNLAYSSDGVTWTKFRGNPVLDLGLPDTRDPKVFWDEHSRQWVMVIVTADEQQIRIFGSPNLKTWKQLSTFGPEGARNGQWECPDLYSLPVDGSPGKTKWVLKIGLNPGHPAGGSGEQYFIGDFDGTRFHNDAAATVERWLDYGRDSYCELTFNNDHGNERHELGWMNNWRYAGEAPTSPWRGGMTIAKTVNLMQEPDGGSVQLMQQPVQELKQLRGDHLHVDGSSLKDLNARLNSWNAKSQTFELELSAQLKSRSDLRLAVLKGAGEETVVGYDAAKGELYVDRSHCAGAQFNKNFPSRTPAPLSLKAGERLRLHIFVDRSSVEVFAQEGRVVLTNLVYPKADSTGLTVDSTDGGVSHASIDVWRLRSIWE